MKDGRTHLAHKAQHAVDLETGAIVGVTVQGNRSGRYDDDRGDGHHRRPKSSEPWRWRPTGTRRSSTRSWPTRDTTVIRRWWISRHSTCGPISRSLIAAGATGRTRRAARDAVYANRRRIRGVRGLALSRRRSESLERPNAHLYETGGMRRNLRGHTNILKRLLVHIGGFNLGLLMRSLARRRHAAEPAGPPGDDCGARHRAVDARGAPLARPPHAIRRSAVRFYAESSFRAATCWRVRRRPLTTGC